MWHQFQIPPPPQISCALPALLDHTCLPQTHNITQKPRENQENPRDGFLTMQLLYRLFPHRMASSWPPAFRSIIHYFSHYPRRQNLSWICFSVSIPLASSCKQNQLRCTSIKSQVQGKTDFAFLKLYGRDAVSYRLKDK